MFRLSLLVSLLFLASSVAQASEIDGFGSRAVDISSSAGAGLIFGATGPRAEPEFAAAFTAYDGAHRPSGIRIQSRLTDRWGDAVTCSTTLNLPPGTQQASHPALTRSGWLLVATTDRPDRNCAEGWKLWAARRGGDLPALTGQCRGWNSWVDLGAVAPAGERDAQPVGSAPDAVVAYDRYTFVFVRDRRNRIAYRMFDAHARTTADPASGWSEWRLLRATDPSLAGYDPRYAAASKIAAAVYNPTAATG